jgi:hypothetical protein
LHRKSDTKEVDYENEEIEAFILYGISESKTYRKFKSNRTLIKDLDRVMRILHTVDSCKDLETGYKALNYEPLKYGLQGYSSVRIGFNTKYRLLFKENESRIRICLIEISEHYGDK